jgi:hypothetical protein
MKGNKVKRNEKLLLKRKMKVRRSNEISPDFINKMKTKKMKTKNY